MNTKRKKIGVIIERRSHNPKQNHFRDLYAVLVIIPNPKVDEDGMNWGQNDGGWLSRPQTDTPTEWKFMGSKVTETECKWKSYEDFFINKDEEDKPDSDTLSEHFINEVKIKVSDAVGLQPENIDVETVIAPYWYSS